MSKQDTGLGHCVHHARHWEWCYGFKKRLEYIKNNKPESEQAIRLQNIGLIPDDRLPGGNSPEFKAYDKARGAYDKAWEAYDKAWEAYDKAWEAYDKARGACDKAWEAYFAKYQKDLDAIHDELFPDCTWDEKRRTIFKEK